MKFVIGVPLALLYFVLTGWLVPHSEYSGLGILVGFIVYVYGIGKLIAWIDHKRTSTP